MEKFAQKDIVNPLLKMSRHPEVKWAERVDKVFITVQLPDAKNVKVNLEPEGVFTFAAIAGAGDNPYELKLQLRDKVNVEESKINIGDRSIFCVVEKADKAWWKKLVRGGEKPPYIKVDWDKWVDEDDDYGLGNLDLGGMDFSKFGDMGGEDVDEFEDSVEEDQEASKPGGSAKLEEDTDEGEDKKHEEKKGAATST